MGFAIDVGNLLTKFTYLPNHKHGLPAYQDSKHHKHAVCGSMNPADGLCCTSESTGTLSCYEDSV